MKGETRWHVLSRARAWVDSQLLDTVPPCRLHLIHQGLAHFMSGNPAALILARQGACSNVAKQPDQLVIWGIRFPYCETSVYFSTRELAEEAIRKDNEKEPGRREYDGEFIEAYPVNTSLDDVQPSWALLDD